MVNTFAVNGNDVYNTNTLTKHYSVFRERGAKGARDLLLFCDMNIFTANKTIFPP